MIEKSIRDKRLLWDLRPACSALRLAGFLRVELIDQPLFQRLLLGLAQGLPGQGGEAEEVFPPARLWW